jgi:hypothetical protein
VFRGARGFLSPEFRQQRMGMDFAFFSASTNEPVAKNFAKNFTDQTESLRSVLFEIEFNGGCKGADVQMISVFPGECEVLFPPCTALSIKKVQWHDLNLCRCLEILDTSGRGSGKHDPKCVSVSKCIQTTCPLCTVQSSAFWAFPAFKRRHHCRQCGRAVCDQHSKAQKPLLTDDGRSTKTCRVCDECKNESWKEKKTELSVASQCRVTASPVAQH